MSTVAFDRVAHLVRVPVRLGRVSQVGVDAGVVEARAGKAPARTQTGRLPRVGNAASAGSGRRPAPPGLGGHDLGGDELRFLVDTGIGVTVVNERLAERADVERLDESYAGRRMSGQLVEAPLVRLPALSLGGYEVSGHVAAAVDLGEGFDGILGPSYFADRVVTTDPAAGTFTVHERGEQVDGIDVPLEIHRDGPSADPFAELVLPGGRTVVVEVDTGSDSLILDTRFMAECGLEAGGAGVTAREGVDETGHSYVRYDATLPGAVHLAAAPGTAQDRPKVIFQEIIHDGLVGSDYLYRYRFSFDLAGERVVLSPPGP